MEKVIELEDSQVIVSKFRNLLRILKDTARAAMFAALIFGSYEAYVFGNALFWEWERQYVTERIKQDFAESQVTIKPDHKNQVAVLLGKAKLDSIEKYQQALYFALSRAEWAEKGLHDIQLTMTYHQQAMEENGL